MSNSPGQNKETAQAFYDLMFNQGKIVEHWDVLQVIPSSSKNANTMF